MKGSTSNIRVDEMVAVVDGVVVALVTVMVVVVVGRGWRGVVCP